MAAAFTAAVARFPGHDFLEVLPGVAQAFGVPARTWTYAQTLREVERLRAAYGQAGYGHGHRAGLLLLNRPEFLFHFIALNSLGVSVVPVSPEWRAAELEYLIAHSEICVAATIAGGADGLRQAARQCGRTLALTDAQGSSIPAATAPPPAADRVPDQDTECALLYTSGTTGRPKGCVLPNEYFLYAGRWYNAIGGLCQVRPGVERMLTPLPMMHMNALAYSTMCMILAGGCLVLLDRFHPRTWWHNVRQSRATIVHYLGVMPAMLLGDAPGPQDRSHNVRFGFGAGVNPRHHAPFEERFGFPLLEAWAMTETGAGAVIIANREPRYVGTASIGVPEPEVEVRIVDEAGAEVGTDEPGELLVRHAGGEPRRGFFRRYLKDEAATEEAWRGGWFHTGDLVRRDAHGVMRFVDRRKNIIRRSGENISAVEVEAVLVQHPQVRSVAVTGVPDELRGDEVFACVVPREPVADAARLARELAQLCHERLAYYKAPGYVAFCESLPLTPTEKVQRAELKALGVALLGRGACIDLRTLKKRGTA
ncbi:MAG: AMP-binding protein [Proteobacteria bacterium]|nr:AMP-binding protein [Pseudomonadota bacterium]